MGKDKQLSLYDKRCFGQSIRSIVYEKLLQIEMALGHIKRHFSGIRIANDLKAEVIWAFWGILHTEASIRLSI